MKDETIIQFTDMVNDFLIENEVTNLEMMLLLGSFLVSVSFEGNLSVSTFDDLLNTIRTRFIEGREVKDGE